MSQLLFDFHLYHSHIPKWHLYFCSCCLISVTILLPEMGANLLNIHLYLCIFLLTVCLPLLHVCLLSCSNNKKKEKARAREGRFLMSGDGLFPVSRESSWLRGQSDMWGGGGGGRCLYLKSDLRCHPTYFSVSKYAPAERLPWE